jgi:transcription elongation factor Elf1
MTVRCLIGHKPILDTTVSPPRTICKVCGITLNVPPNKAIEDLDKIKERINKDTSQYIEDNNYIEEEDEDDEEDDEEEYEEPTIRERERPKAKKTVSLDKPKEKEMEAVDILTASIEYFGESKQAIKTIEELSELQKAISKALIGNEDIEKISEEIADVEIMLAQLKIIYQNQDVVEKHIKNKLAKLMNKINEQTEVGD